MNLELIPDAEWPVTVARRLARWVSANSPGRLCLPTGKTVEPLYERVASLTDFAGIELLLLDEFGGLPGGDPGRCESMIRTGLLDHMAGDPVLHLPNVDVPELEEEAHRYGELVDTPGIDLAIVGLGANGHIGMNEPGSDADTKTRVVELAGSTSTHAYVYGATTPPTWGITIGLKSLLAAKEIWLLVTGHGKNEILRRTLNDEIGSTVPATFLRRHPKFSILVDESAGT